MLADDNIWCSVDVAHTLDWSDDATVIPRRRSTLMYAAHAAEDHRHLLFYRNRQETVHTSSGVSIPNRWPKRSLRMPLREQDRPYHYPTRLSSIWLTTRAVYVLVVIAQPTAEEANVRGANIGRCRKKTFRYSYHFGPRADVARTARRRRVLAKASLIWCNAVVNCHRSWR